MATNGTITSNGDRQVPLSVIIVGAGFAGMTAAVECRNRGMKTTLVEKYMDSNKYGDIIDFFANAGRIIQGWDNGKVAEELLSVGINRAQKFQIKKWTGQTVYQDPWFHKPQHEGLQFAGHRGEMWDIVLRYCQKIGVEFIFGDGVVKYIEDSDSAGVVLQSGKVLKGDCVIAADGPKSLGREQALGLEDKKTNSGYAIYRSFFYVDDKIRSNPLLKDYTNPEEDMMKFWIGPHVHMLAYSWKGGKDVAWVMTHRVSSEFLAMFKVPSLTILLYRTSTTSERAGLSRATRRRRPSTSKTSTPSVWPSSTLPTPPNWSTTNSSGERPWRPGEARAAALS